MALDDALDTTNSAPVVVDAVVSRPQGLHLRPATEFAQIVGDSGCQVDLLTGGMQADGASVLELAMLALGPGAAVRLSVRGATARETARALVLLLESRE